MSTAGSTPSAPPLDAELQRLLKRMRLPYIRRAAPELLATATAQRWDPAEVLKALLAEEVSGRDRSALATRRARAGFPTGKTFAAWDPALSSIPAPTQSALRTLEWIHRRENLVVCGPSGTGKTFLLEALGQQAVEAGLHVAWFSLEALGALVRRHRADDTVTKAITKILRADLVCIDDIGLLAVGADAAEGLYRLVDAAYEKRSIALSSNLHPAGFDELMPKTLATATVATATPRPRLPNQRRQRAPHPSPRRQGGERLDITPGHVRWPRTGRSRGHHRADLVAVYGQILMSLDTWLPTRRACSHRPCRSTGRGRRRGVRRSAAVG